MADSKAIVRSSVNRNIERRMWATMPAGHVKVSGGTGPWGTFSGAYSFYILDLATNTVVSVPGLDPANRTELAMYQFPTPPQQYECSEPASTTIVPTQDGGKFVESHGSLFKDIRISGTVGFRPSPASTELVPGLGKMTGIQLSMPSALQTFMNDERGLSPKEATGLDDIIFLRNIFRHYWDSKADPEAARRTALVWIYAKESESYIVEPMQFTTSRESGKPLSWQYQIQLRTLYPLGYTFSIINDPLNILDQVSGALSLINKAIRDIGRFINEFAGMINYLKRLPFKIVDSIMGGATEVMTSLANLQNSMDFSQIPKQTWEKWRSDCLHAAYILTGVTNNPSIPTAVPSEPGASGNVIADKQLPFNRTMVPPIQEGRNGDAAKVLRDGLRIGNALMTNDFFWTQSKQIAARDYAKAYLDEFGETPDTFGSPLNVANITIPSSAEEAIIECMENIRSLAKRLTADEANWKQIAILNNLKAPYIAAVRGDGVLAYGDKILIPKTANALDAYSGVKETTIPDANSQALSPMMRKYGRDIKLVAVSEDGLGDLAVNQRGDLDLIEGIDNVYQALLIKFSTEQGELATHPTFGAKYPIGEKFPGLAKLQEFSVNVQRTIMQDLRVKEIEDLKISVSADQLYVSAKLRMRGSDFHLPLSFTVRR